MATKSKSKGKSKSAKSGKATKAKGNGAKKPTVDAGTLKSAAAFASKINKEYGPCVAIRGVAEKFKSLGRAEVLDIAKGLKINKFTASRQFHLLRSGEVESGL